MNLNDFSDMYPLPKANAHPNIYKPDENIYVIKNFSTPEEREFCMTFVDKANEAEWNKDQREWWNNKILFLGENQEFLSVSNGILDRIRLLLEEEYNWVVGGMSSIHRMRVGEGMFLHADNPTEEMGKNNFVQYGMVLYHNDFNGGDLVYPELGIQYHPEAGDLVIHPGISRYKHEVSPVTGPGNRYVSTTFAFDPEIKKLRDLKMVYQDENGLYLEKDPNHSWQK